MAIPNFYSTQDALFNDLGPSDGLTWQIPQGAGCGAPGTSENCSVILREANTGWWFAPNVAACIGDCVGQPSNPPVPLSGVLCRQIWINEITVQLGHLPTLGDVFPAWALSQALIDPTLHFNITDAQIVCSVNWFTVPINLTLRQCPKGYYYDTTTKSCQPVTNPQPQKCPPGYYWDVTQGKCVQNPIGPQPNPEQDEFQDCCDETQAALTQIENLISNLQLGGGTDATCCTNVVAAIGLIAQQLAAIAKLIPTGGTAGGPVDLSKIIAPLNAIAGDLHTLAVNGAPPLHIVVDNFPTTTGGGGPPVDLTEVIKQLTRVADEGDVQQTVLNYLTSNGFMTGADAQVISGARWSDALVGIFRTYGWRAVEWVHSTIGITWTGAGYTLDFAKFTQALPQAFASAVNAALSAGGAPLYPEVKGIIDGVVMQLRPAGAPVPGDSKVDGDLLVSKTLAPALIINALSWLFGFLGWEVSEQLREYVEIATTLTGFEEVREVKLGQMMQAGPIAAARLQAQNLYRQNIPGSGEAASWAARRLVPPAAANRIMAWSGIHDQYQPAILNAAYSGMSARQLVRLSATGLFNAADIQDELNFDGMRPASQHRYQLALPYLATEPQRNQLRSQLESEYEAGLLSLDELIGQIDSADHLLDRDKLIVNRVNSKVAMDIATALEREYSTMYQAGLIDHNMYAANLAGIGLQQWKIDALVGVGDARRAATLQRQLLADERALVRATAAKERQAAMLGYSTGTLSAPALLAALVATGLTAQQAGAWTAIAALKKEGNLRWIYGLQLQPAQATLLKERVSALTTQVEKGYITPQEYVKALDALKIPAHWVNGLLAKAEATIAKTKGGALVQVNLQ